MKYREQDIFLGDSHHMFFRDDKIYVVGSGIFEIYEDITVLSRLAKPGQANNLCDFFLPPINSQYDFLANHIGYGSFGFHDSRTADIDFSVPNRA